MRPTNILISAYIRELALVALLLSAPSGERRASRDEGNREDLPAKIRQRASILRSYGRILSLGRARRLLPSGR